MPIKAAFFDIDGTLVSFNTHKIPHSSIEAIKEIKKKKIKIFISTGRPKSFITNLKEIEPLIDGYISFNGALAEINSEIIFMSQLPKEDVFTMMQDATKHNYTLAICGREKVAVHNYTDAFKELFIKGLGINSVDIHDSIEPLLEHPILQMSPFFSIKEEARILPKLAGSESLRWHPLFTDISPRGINKGITLAKVTDHIGINLNECMAFGDGGNDKGMLSVAGIGIAMGNANNDVKLVADYVTTAVDDNGIANALKHFSLIDK